MPSLVPTHRQPISSGLRLAAGSHGPGEGTAEVAEIWRILWHRRGWILATAVALIAVTMLYCLFTPSLYTAKVQILVDPHDRQVLSNEANAGTVAPDGGVTQAESQVSVIQSTEVLLRAIAVTHLTADPDFDRVGLFQRFVGFLKRLGGKPSIKPGEAEERTLAGLRRSLSVSRADKVLVIDVAVRAPDPNKAARVANAIADAYIADQTHARAQAAGNLSDELTAHLAEQRQRVQAAADAVERYRAAHNMVMATGQLVSEQQLTALSRQLSDAQNRTAMLKARMDEIKRQRSAAAPADATAAVLQSPVISQLRAQEGALVQREADLESQLGPRHPALVAARDQLRDVRQLINAELSRIAKSARAEYSTAVADEHALSLQLEGLKKQTLSTDQASVHLKELQRDLDAVRTVYSNSLVRAQESRQQANVDSTTARIITRAFPPLQRSWPPTLLLLIGALIAGLSLGAGIALLMESLTPTVLSMGQIETMTDAPVVGILPPDATVSGWRRFLGRLPGNAKRLAANRASQGDAAARRQTVIDLALRRIFGASSLPPGRPYVRSLLVTSGLGDAEARQKVVELLGEVAADLGERVLMVDADFAGNQETQNAGLLDVLRGERSIESVLYFEPGSNVAFVPKGRRQSSAPSRVGQVFARRMLTEAQRRFDLVVINGGAAVDNLRMEPLVGAIDEVLLVARLNVTPKREVEAVSEALSVMGCFVTAVLLLDTMAEV